MVWDVFGYASQSPLVHIAGILSSDHYISVVSSPMALSFDRTLQNVMFQQDNVQSHVTGIVHTFLEIGNVQLLPLLAFSRDFLSTENI